MAIEKTLNRMGKITRWTALVLICGAAVSSRAWSAEEKPSWVPKIYIYQPPPPEISTSPVFRTVDPQIIQKLIELLDEQNLGKTESLDETPILGQIQPMVTPEGLELKARITQLGVSLSESLAWEQIKHIRVISEQNLKQRLTTVARWDHEPIVRSIALIALATLRDKNDSVFFKEALWSKNIGIRYAAIEALKIWADPSAIPLLQEVVKRDQSMLVRVAAAKAMFWLNEPSGKDMLRTYLQDKDWFVRAFSAGALGEVGNYEDYDLLLNQLSREQLGNSNEFVVSEIAIGVLKLFPQKVAKDKEEREKRKRKKKGIVQPEPVAQVEPPKQNAGILFELDPLVVTAPRLKIPQGELVDPRVNFQLLKLIREKQDLRISNEQANLSIAYKDLDSLVTPKGIRLKVRYTVLGFLLTEGLAGTNDFELVDQLVRMVRERKNPDVSSYALISLGFGKDLSHLGLFQDALRSDVVSERFAAVEALQAWALPEARSILIGVTKLDNSPIVRVYAAQAAMRLGDMTGKDYLIRALDDQEWVVRAMAMRYLGELGSGQDYGKALSYLGARQKPIEEAEMCSALLRLHAKKFEEESIQK